MTRWIDDSDSSPTIRDLKIKIPTIDELMRPPQPPAWRPFLLPPAPSKNDGPFGPVPIVPPLAPPWSPPIEVDPPSRPPEWMFGPPYLSGAPTPVPSPGSAQEKPGALLGIMAQAGLIDPSSLDGSPPGGLLGLIQEYLRNNESGTIDG